MFKKVSNLYYSVLFSFMRFVIGCLAFMFEKLMVLNRKSPDKLLSLLSSFKEEQLWDNEITKKEMDMLFESISCMKENTMENDTSNTVVGTNGIEVSFVLDKDELVSVDVKEPTPTIEPSLLNQKEIETLSNICEKLLEPVEEPQVFVDEFFENNHFEASQPVVSENELFSMLKQQVEENDKLKKDLAKLNKKFLKLKNKEKPVQKKKNKK